MTSQTFRLLGWALMIPGVPLACAGALLLLLAAPRLVGGPGVRLLVNGIFGLIMLVGLAVVAAGLRQVVSGERSQSLMTVVIVLLIALALIVAVVRVV